MTDQLPGWFSIKLITLGNCLMLAGDRPETGWPMVGLLPAFVKPISGLL